MVVGTKGWFSRTGARTVSKIRQSGASDLETTDRKAHWSKKRSQPVANHQKILRRDNDLSKMEWLGVTVRGRRETENPGPSTQGECLCMSVHDSEQSFLGFGGVWFLRYFPPQKKTRRWSPWRHETTKVEPSPGAEGLGEESERPSCSTWLPSGLAESYKRL